LEKYYGLTKNEEIRQQFMQDEQEIMGKHSSSKNSPPPPPPPPPITFPGLNANGHAK